MRLISVMLSRRLSRERPSPTSAYSRLRCIGHSESRLCGSSPVGSGVLIARWRAVPLRLSHRSASGVASDGQPLSPEKGPPILQSVSIDRALSYPHVPRSTATLIPGQYWGINLPSGRWACGRVLQTQATSGTGSRTLFLAGLMQWVGTAPPTEDSLAGAVLLDQAQAHIKTILETGRAILGHRALERDGVEPRLEVSHRKGGTVWLQRGYERLRPATSEEAATLPVFSGWGYRFIALLAESRLDGAGIEGA
jgi:hypothetical protein